MTTPEWAKYEMTHATGSGALPSSSNTWGRPADEGAGVEIPEWRLPRTPTTRLATWAVRSRSRWWGPLIALVLAVGYFFAADWARSAAPSGNLLYILMVLFLWNSLKLGIAGLLGLVRFLWSLVIGTVSRTPGAG